MIKTKPMANNPIQWPPIPTGVFTASERRLFAPVGKTAPAGPVGWTAKERRAFAKRSSKSRSRSR